MAFPSKALATKKMNRFMRTIYSQDVFIKSSTATELANDIYVFVKSFLFQARAAYELGLSHFPLHPKVHTVHEVGHELKRQARIAGREGFCLNPAIYCCALDEDCIGRIACVSRCVSPRLAALRTLQRYLCHINIAWARA